MKKKKFKINKAKGILLDLGCGNNKQKHFIGMDKQQNLTNVDIVHDMEKFPWPLPKESCLQIVASHILEHLKPWNFIPILDEMWRVLKPGGDAFIFAPYPTSIGWAQDPTHYTQFNQNTFFYFDPNHPFYQFYRPKPWQTLKLVWSPHANIEIVLQKLPLEK